MWVNDNIVSFDYIIIITGMILLPYYKIHLYPHTHYLLYIRNNVAKDKGKSIRLLWKSVFQKDVEAGKKTIYGTQNVTTSAISERCGFI